MPRGPMGAGQEFIERQDELSCLEVMRKYGMPDVGTGFVYYGRGYVQLTWPGNYKTIGKAIGYDLYHNPDLALEPNIAYSVMSYGMRHGSFTGARLAQHINDKKCDYVEARRIINGTDCAEKIAGYAAKFERILAASIIPEEVIET